MICCAVFVEPLFLRCAQHGRVAVVHAFAWGHAPTIVARLVRPEAARVEHADRRQIAESEPAVCQRQRAVRQRAAAHGHIFVPRLHRRLTPEGEDFLRDGRVLRVIVNPVVLHLVVVEALQEHLRGSRRLQIEVHQVLRIVLAVVVERNDLAQPMLAHLGYGQPLGPVIIVVRIFVDEIAIVVDEGEIVFRDVAIGGVEATLVMLAAAYAEAQLRDGGTGRRQRARTAGQRAVGADREAIPIGAIGLEAGNFGVNAMAQLGPGQLGAFGDDRAEVIILGNLPVDREGGHRHAPVRFERLGCQARPHHEPVARRIARRDPQLERVFAEPALREQNGRRRKRRHGGACGGGADKRATGDHVSGPMILP